MWFRFRLTLSNSQAAGLIPLSSGDAEIWPAPWETTPNRWPTAKPWETPEVEKCLYFLQIRRAMPGNKALKNKAGVQTAALQTLKANRRT